MISAKNIVVTGGNSGVGYETVKGLYEEGHNVIFGARNIAKNNQVVSQISQSKGGSILSFPLDLSKRKSVEQFVKNVTSKFDHVDILINNAGLILSGQKQINQQGIQMTLAINHFGHFYLTYLLWDALRKSSQARIINVSSQIHYRAPKNYLQDIQCSKKSFSGMSQYATSKLYNVLFTRGLNDLIIRHKIKNIKTASLHPGVVDSGFYESSNLLKCFSFCCGCFMSNNQEGARTSLHLSKIPFGELRSGQYYDSDTRFKEMDRRGRNEKDVQTLWKMSEKAYDISFE